MLNKSFNPAQQSAFDARFAAQKIAFGPVVFQAVYISWKSGLLAQLAQAGSQGLSLESLHSAGEHGLSLYAIKLLLESALSAGVVDLSEGRYRLAKTGQILLQDRLTQVNFDFMQHICYAGLKQLETSLRTEQPAGLPELGPWSTLYQGLADLPEPAKSSWFNFDHFYSDNAYQQALPKVFARKPRRLLDIGANTGKWSLACLAYDPDVEMHLMDLPVQLNVARHNLDQAGYGTRYQLHPTDLLDPASPVPSGMDAIWMSQFLTCFSLPQVGSILNRASQALADQGRIYILDTFWDRQSQDIAAYCLINTSPYFTAMANGNSMMHQFADIEQQARLAGLRLLNIHDGLGLSHSLLEFGRV